MADRIGRGGPRSAPVSGMAQTSFAGRGDDFRGYHRVHSPKTWEELVHGEGRIRRLRCVTYCNSPAVVLEFFKKYKIKNMELVHGDYTTDYRELLVGRPQIADELEHLKESGDLVIWKARSRTLHTKMYELVLEDGRVRLLMGSANLTRSATKNQVNLMAEWETAEGSARHQMWMRHYDAHKELCDRFLDDLTEVLEESDDERQEIVERWVQGRVTAATPELEAAERVVKKVRKAVDPVEHPGREPEAIEVTMTGFPDSTRDSIEGFYGGKMLGDVFRIEPRKFARTITERYQVPHVVLRPDRRVLIFHGPDKEEVLGEEPPWGDSTSFDEALGQIHQFLDTVDLFAVKDYPLHVKAHMYEAILYFLWSPFADATATLLRQERVESTKRLPYLYISGPPNAGKDTLARFAYNLISPDSWKPRLVNGKELNNTYVENLRYASTVYPAVLSDVEKERIERASVLRNYWEEKPHQLNVPAIIMTSNDTRPGKWFRERAKMLTFDCVFTSGIEGDRYVQNIMDDSNPLFSWFIHEYLDRKVQPNDDPLYLAREIVGDFYEESTLGIPNYFPDEAGEEKFSLELLELQKKEETGTFDIRQRNGDLFLEFGADVQPSIAWRVVKRLPNECRAEVLGRRILIKNPDAFWPWWGTADTKDGLLHRFAKRLRRSPK